jgi:hypothetical protein
LPGKVFAKLGVEVCQEQVLMVLTCVSAGGHAGAPFPLSIPNG